jgi:hypothetical protein
VNPAFDLVDAIGMLMNNVILFAANQAVVNVELKKLGIWF